MTNKITAYKFLFPEAANDNNTLFGGLALKWMDEVAYIAATKYTKQQMVTLSVDNVKFLKPIPVGSIIELEAWIKHSDALHVIIAIAGYYESKATEAKALAITAQFTFVAVNEKNRPIRIHPAPLQII